MLVYVEACSGSYRYDVDGVYHADGDFCIHVKQTNNPETHTDDWQAGLLLLQSLIVWLLIAMYLMLPSSIKLVR